MTGLPRLLLIGDRFTDELVAQKIEDAVRSGLRWVQLRDHAADADAFRRRAEVVSKSLRSVDDTVLISINGDSDLAMAVGAGLHLRSDGRDTGANRAFPFGKSVHDTSESESFRGDYVLFSPVFPTFSKPGHRGVGTKALSLFCGACQMPVIAMGGVTPDRIALCLKAGAHGVAVLSGILEAEDSGARVSEYLEALRRYR